MPDRIRSNKKATASRGFTPLRIALAEKENMNMNELTLTRENFEEEVLRGDLPVLVDFWATWCGPCRMLAPTVETIASEYDGKVTVVKCNVDDCEDVAAEYGIRNIPTLLFFKGGQVVDKLVGNVPKSEITAKLDTLV